QIVHLSLSFSFFFFFQAEDGIRDRNVTGVQTCALPISLSVTASAACLRRVGDGSSGVTTRAATSAMLFGRQESWLSMAWTARRCALVVNVAGSANSSMLIACSQLISAACRSRGFNITGT